MLYKQIENGIIVRIGESRIIPPGAAEVTEEEKAQLKAVMDTKPEDTLESVYRLSAETGQYEPFPRTHDETVAWYAENVNDGMDLSEVPEDYRTEVETATQPELTAEETVINSIMQEVSESEY